MYGPEFVKHSVIADDCGIAGQRRLCTTFTNPPLKCLTSRQFWQRAAAVAGLGFNEMNKAIVFEPQREIANAICLRSFDALKNPGD
jgi:hypothetical protein